MLEQVQTVKLTAGWRGGGETNVHGGSNFKGSYEADFGKFSGLACSERKETCLMTQ